MSPKPLAEKSGNTTSRKELTPYLRGYIVGKHLGGWNPTQISRELQIPRSTVANTIKQASLREDGKSMPRSGRPKSTTERDRRHVLQLIKRNPSITYQGIREQTGIDIASSTFRAILKESRGLASKKTTKVEKKK